MSDEAQEFTDAVSAWPPDYVPAEDDEAADALLRSAEPYFPEVNVQLTGLDGSTGAIMGRVAEALRRSGHGEVVPEFRDAVFDSRSYREVLRTVMGWVSVS